MVLPVFNKVEQRAKQKAEEASTNLVVGQTVHSFTGNQIYTVNNHTCSCCAPKPCKHMFLFKRSQSKDVAEQEAPRAISAEAVQSEKTSLGALSASTLLRSCSLWSQITPKASRDQLASLQARIQALNYEMYDIANNRLPNATQQ